MRFDLKTPCKNCPFRTDETAIRFQCEERAREIEEQAYRRGFPCHLSADYFEAEDEYSEESGYVFGKTTQHCAGAIIMYLKSSLGPWPGIDNDEDLHEKLEAQMDMMAPVFDSEGEFIEASA